MIGIGCHLICIAFGVNITLMYFNRDAGLDTVFYEHKSNEVFLTYLQYSSNSIPFRLWAADFISDWPVQM